MSVNRMNPTLFLGSPFSAALSGVGKGDGSDLKVKIILKKQLIFQGVCAKQENCTVSPSHVAARSLLCGVAV